MFWWCAVFGGALFWLAPQSLAFFCWSDGKSRPENSLNESELNLGKNSP